MDGIQMNLIHDESIYVKYFDINTMCILFDHELDEETLCKNITSILIKDCVQFEENQKVGVEIPEWGMKYDVILKSNSINNKYFYYGTESTKSSTKITTSTKLDNDGPFGNVQTCMPETKIWTTKAIKLLIENRGDLDHEFNSNKKNYKIWEKISNILQENGIAVSAPNCNTKFRNLMATFRDNMQRANKSGEGAINWEYYLLMKQYFGKKDSVTPNKNTILESSLSNSSKLSLKNGNKSDEYTSSQLSQLLHRNDEEINSDEEMIPKRKKKKNIQEM